MPLEKRRQFKEAKTENSGEFRPVFIFDILRVAAAFTFLLLTSTSTAVESDLIAPAHLNCQMCN
jgi:hypothetical protein